MHKTKAIVGFIVALVAIFAFLSVPDANAKEVDIEEVRQTPIIFDETNSTQQIRILWSTDVSASGTVKYGTTSGSYTEEVTTDTDTDHLVILKNLSADTTYYYKIIVEDLDGNTDSSRERSFTTQSADLTATLVLHSRGSNKISFQNWSNKFAVHSVAYGTSPDALNKQATMSSSFCDNWAPTPDSYSVAKNLTPDTDYYFQLTATQTTRNADGTCITVATATSQVYKVKTLGKPKITSVSPVRGKRNTVITITGRNFGSGEAIRVNPDYLEPNNGRVWFSCTRDRRPDTATDPYPLPSSTRCDAEIISWSNTKIVAKLTGGTPTEGRIYVLHKVGVPFVGFLDLFTVKGPIFNTS